MEPTEYSSTKCREAAAFFAYRFQVEWVAAASSTAAIASMGIVGSSNLRLRSLPQRRRPDSPGAPGEHSRSGGHDHAESAWRGIDPTQHHRQNRTRPRSPLEWVSGTPYDCAESPVWHSVARPPASSAAA